MNNKKLIFIFLILAIIKSYGNVEQEIKDALAEIAKLSKTKKLLMAKYCQHKIEYYQCLMEYKLELRQNIPNKFASQDEWTDKFLKLAAIEKKLEEKLKTVNDYDKNLDFIMDIKIHNQSKKALQAIDKISGKARDIYKLEAIIQKIKESNLFLFF